MKKMEERKKRREGGGVDGEEQKPLLTHISMFALGFVVFCIHIKLIQVIYIFRLV